jgi:hypothetical protein
MLSLLVLADLPSQTRRMGGMRIQSSSITISVDGHKIYLFLKKMIEMRFACYNMANVIMTQ